MALRLIYITNDIEVACAAQGAGVDWIMVDLEWRGKVERQGGRDTVISRHTIEDVRCMRNSLTSSDLVVRVNPVGEWSKQEIDQAVECGADIIMLPFFKSQKEVEIFIGHVAGRAKTCLLLETAEAVDCVDDILDVAGIDYIHIGLNDLHLAYKMSFMFEPLANGLVDFLCQKISKVGIPYGFGGVARIGSLIPPAENILTEHYRLGSSIVILSRSFCNSSTVKDVELVRKKFSTGVSEIRALESQLLSKTSDFFEKNRLHVRDDILLVARK